jgi:hypothetical protein
MKLVSDINFIIFSNFSQVGEYEHKPIEKVKNFSFNNSYSFRVLINFFYDPLSMHFSFSL